MKNFLPLLLVYFLPSYCISQQLYRSFATQEVHQRLLKENPGINEVWRAIEQHTAKFQKAGNIKPLTIPVVFHIIYHDSKDRVGEDQVMSQIEALNRDFGMPSGEIRHPADTLEGFAERAADPGIEFCLATVTTLGSITPGIHYVRSLVPVWNTDDAIKSSQREGTDAIMPENILNVWVARLNDGVSGYAQMPGFPAGTDGVVIDYRFFGTTGTALPPYDEGKTLTHLIGNYLNLFDIWGNGLCNDDYVEDTPVHNAPNYGCPGYKHVSTCRDNPVEMTMNFMDNTDDACMYMFTHGQVMRMQAALLEKGPRYGLVSDADACAPLLEERPEELVELNKGLNDLAVLSLTVFPNPASGEVHLLISSGVEEPCTVSVYNSLGAVVHVGSLDLYKGEQQMTLDSQGWAEGSYYVKVQSTREIISRLFFIKNN